MEKGIRDLSGKTLKNLPRGIKLKKYLEVSLKGYEVGITCISIEIKITLRLYS
jgi:hypothetical protein